jgi:hypothetical protein
MNTNLYHPQQQKNPELAEVVFVSHKATKIFATKALGQGGFTEDCLKYLYLLRLLCEEFCALCGKKEVFRWGSMDLKNHKEH